MKENKNLKLYWNEDPDHYVPIIAGILALIAFICVLIFTNEINTYQTIYAISMGLLGSSLFLLYNLIGVIKEHRFSGKDVLKNIARLFLGPVAGWLALFMWIGTTSKNFTSTENESIKTMFGNTAVWLPFLAGFSADLMVGIINQAIRAIKFTLGIEQIGKQKSE